MRLSPTLLAVFGAGTAAVTTAVEPGLLSGLGRGWWEQPRAGVLTPEWDVIGPAPNQQSR